MVEFHPLCVKNPQTDGWLRTCSCGHQLVIRPLSIVSATNSCGKIADSPATKSGLITQKNGSLLFASPQPNSIRCCAVTTAKLPKFT
ncbi:hypothetical protein D8674_040986 [Pyrus ussuriensis x Pyrus communis]|uniref:Uncharacterized protein n=1 Tax=Pyrus ussuriensis x Pyrus communis TaxID=2448454 RepID=A0A5N5H884_9ROSA|nr:hypothetical protein D8674_040986 [Pyrus ussuriensis x Pyrus communis]